MWRLKTLRLLSPEGDGGGGGGNAPAAISLTDDSMVLPPGATEPVSWKDFQAGYVPKGDYEAREQAFTTRQSEWDTGRQSAEQMLLQRARELQRATQPKTAPEDPLAAVKGQAFVDGSTIADLYGRIQKEGLGPLQQWAQQINGHLGTFQKKLADMESRQGTADRRQSDETRDQWITKTLTDSGFDPQNATARKMVENYYFSYDLEKGHTREEMMQELAGMFTNDMTEFRTMFRGIDQAEAKKAREAHLPSRGGTTTPSGPSQGKFETAADIARKFADAGAFDEPSPQSEGT